jgi:hypothetical protein
MRRHCDGEGVLLSFLCPPGIKHHCFIACDNIASNITSDCYTPGAGGNTATDGNRAVAIQYDRVASGVFVACTRLKMSAAVLTLKAVTGQNNHGAIRGEYLCFASLYYSAAILTL